MATGHMEPGTVASGAREGGNILGVSPRGPVKGCCIAADPSADFRMMYLVPGMPWVQSIALGAVCTGRACR